MNVNTLNHLCGKTCFPGGVNCNNYCNHDKNKSMPENPNTYQSLVVEGYSMWMDVINTIVGYVPQEKTILELLEAKYAIKKQILI